MTLRGWSQEVYDPCTEGRGRHPRLPGQVFETARNDYYRVVSLVYALVSDYSGKLFLASTVAV